MAGKKISELDIIARTLSGEEMIPVAFEEQNYRITPEQIREYVEAAANEFTNTNSFKAGKWSAGRVSVDNHDNLVVGLNSSAQISRVLQFTNAATANGAVKFGAFLDGTDIASNYAYVALNGDTYESVNIYRFGLNKITVPDALQIRTLDNYRVIDVEADAIRFGSSKKVTAIYSTDSNLRHSRGTTMYDIWDKFMLPDPVTLSGAQTVTGSKTFTGTNTFTGGKFSVAGSSTFSVNTHGEPSVDTTGRTGGWTIDIASLKRNDAVMAGIGVYADNDTFNYVYLRLPGENYSSASYRFTSSDFRVPNAVSVKTVSGTRLIESLANGTYIGDTGKSTYIYSDTSDLIHYRGSTRYSLWDAYNLKNPADLAKDNEWTGTQIFEAVKFRVRGTEASFVLSDEGDLISGSAYDSTSWSRGLQFADNNVLVGSFGVQATTTDNVPAVTYVGIGVGAVTPADMQYKFYDNGLYTKNDFILCTQGSQRVIEIDTTDVKVGSENRVLELYSSNGTLTFHVGVDTIYNVWTTRDFDPGNYLPKSGGTLTGSVRVNVESMVLGPKGYAALSMNTAGDAARSHYVMLGNYYNQTYLLTLSGSDILHYVGDVDHKYRVWDERNLPNPSSVESVDYMSLPSISSSTQEELQAILDKVTKGGSMIYGSTTDTGYAMFVPALSSSQVSGDSVYATIQFMPQLLQSDGRSALSLTTVGLTKEGGTITPTYQQTTGLLLSPDEYEGLVLKNVANTFTQNQVIKTTTSNIPLLINYAASGATEVLLRMQLEGVTKGTLGYSTTNGTFLYDYATTSYVAIKSDGAYYGKENSMKKILVDGDAVKTPTSEGNEGDVLTVVGGTPTWKAPTSGGTTTWKAPTSGGTTKEPDAFLRKQVELLGATYNEETGFYEFHGITDLTEDDMMLAWNWRFDRWQASMKDAFYNYPGRVVLPPVLDANWYGAIDAEGMFMWCQDLEVISFGVKSTAGDSSTANVAFANVENLFNQCTSLRVIYGVFDFYHVDTIPDGVFSTCPLLESIQLRNAHGTLNMTNCPNLTAECIDFICRNSDYRSGWTFKVSETVWNKMQDESNAEYHALLDLQGSANWNVTFVNGNA